MSRDIVIQAMTAEAFAPFGDFLDCAGEVDEVINQGQCGRYHDCARLDFWCGRSGISPFNVNPRELPLLLGMVERHPDGSQAFVPLAFVPFPVVVAPDYGRKPGMPLAFRTSPGQAINYHKGTWHGILTPLQTSGLFAVVGRIGASENL